MWLVFRTQVHLIWDCNFVVNFYFVHVAVSNDFGDLKTIFWSPWFIFSVNFRKSIHLSKLSYFDISSTIVSGESLFFLKIWLLCHCRVVVIFCVSKRYSCCALWYRFFLAHFIMMGCLVDYFVHFLKLPVSKCIFSYAPKISKDLLAKKDHLISWYWTRPQVFNGSVKNPMIPRC